MLVALRSILLTRIQLSQVLNCNCVLARSAPCMVHLLRASAVVYTLVRGGHRAAAAHVVKCIDAPILLKTLRYRLIFGKLVHDHLLMSLLGSQHI